MRRQRPASLRWLPPMGFLQGAGSVLDVFGEPRIDHRRFEWELDDVVLRGDLDSIAVDLRRCVDAAAGEQQRLFDVDQLTSG